MIKQSDNQAFTHNTYGRAAYSSEGKAANTSIGGGSRTQEVVPYWQAGAAALRRAVARSESGVAATARGGRSVKETPTGSWTGWPARRRSGEPRHAATTWGGR